MRGNVMLKPKALGIALVLTASGPLHANETIAVESLSKPALRQVIEAAPDDAVIEFQGQKKTKAQLRSDWLAAHKPPSPSDVKARFAAPRAKEAAEARAAQEEAARRIADENANVDTEFGALKAR
jgi:hypothetical protein